MDCPFILHACIAYIVQALNSKQLMERNVYGNRAQLFNILGPIPSILTEAAFVASKLTRMFIVRGIL